MQHLAARPFEQITLKEEVPPPVDAERSSRNAFMLGVSRLPLEPGALANLSPYIQQAQLELNKRGEESVRQEVAHTRRSAKIDALLGLDDEEEAHFAVEELIALPREAGANTALEEEAGDAIALANALQADPFTGTTDFLNASRQQNEAKALIWQRAIEDVFEERQERRWGVGLAEMFFLQSIPGYASRMNTGKLAEFTGTTQNFWDNIFPGDAVIEESGEFHNLLREMSVEEFAEFTPILIQSLRDRASFLGLTDLSFMQHMMEGLWDAPTAIETNSMAMVDNTPAAVFAGQLVRMGSTTIAGASSRASKVSQVANAVTVARQEGIEVGAQTINGDAGDLVGAVSSSFVNPFGSPTVPPLGQSVSHFLEETANRMREALDHVGVTPTRRLNAEEAPVARESAQSALAERVGQEVVDVDIRTTELVGGSFVEEVLATFGRRNGPGGYASERSAQRASRQRGFEPDTFQGDDGTWYWRAAAPVRETGFFTAPLESNATSPLSRWLLGGGAGSDRSLLGAALVGEGTAANFSRGVIKGLQRTMRRLNNQELRVLKQVWADGNARMVWLDEDAFVEAYTQANKGNPPRQRVWEAYRQNRETNDIDYLLRADTLYREMQTEGYESLRLTDGRIKGLADADLIGRPLRSGENPSRRVWDVSEARMVDAPSEVPSGHRIVRLNEPVKVGPEGHQYMVRDLYVPDTGVQFRPLRRDVLPYQPGGHRMPQGNFFVKQAQWFVDADGGRTAINPRAFIAARNRGEARAWRDAMEEVRGILKGAGDNWDSQEVFDQIDEIVGGYAGIDEADTIMEAMRKGEFNIDDAFEVVADRELPSRYLELSADDLNMVDATQNPDLIFARNAGRMYTGKRGGQVLRDWLGDDAPSLDMLQVAQRSLRNVGEMMALGDYKLEALNRFRQTYGKYFSSGASNDDLLNARVQAPSDVIEGLEANRAQIRRILGTPTEFEQTMQRAQRAFSAWVAGDDPLTWRYRISTAVADWKSNTNGVQALRSAAFDMKLGMFNIAQFPLQISTMWAAINLRPKWGVQGVASAALGRVALLNKHTIDGMIKNGAHELVGMSADELRKYMLSIRRSGFFKMGGNHAMMDEAGPDGLTFTGNYLSRATHIANDFKEAARFFFYEAETANRLVGGHIGWRELRAERPNLSVDSAEFQREWIRRADKYSLQMSNASRAWWQRGALSIPTQFWSYSARMMETMAGKDFTWDQKLRLIAGQSLMWGTAGVPGLGLPLWLMDQFTGEDERAAALNTWRGFVERGASDHLVNWATGADALIGERIGAGQLPESILRDFFGASRFGDATGASLVGGATWSIWNDVGEDLYEVYRWGAREMGHGGMRQTRGAVERLFRNISTYSNYTKARALMQYSAWVSTSDEDIATELPDASAVAAFMSFAPGALRDLEQSEEYLNEGSQTVEDYRDAVSRLRTQMDRDPANSDEYVEQIGDLMSLAGLDVARIVLSELDPPKSLLERRLEQVDRRSEQRALVETVERLYND